MALAHGGQILLSAVTAGLVEGFATVALGEFQLRGLARPERVHQVISPRLERDFPPLRGERGPTHNLPAALTSFVGRQAEIGTVAVRVAEGRLVSLLGPGGAGKTRLAIEAGRRLVEEFPDGVWLAELAVLRDPAQVAATVARPMGHHDPLAEAGGPGVVRDRLTAAIAHQRVLLVLDNCEQVVEAAAELVTGLLGQCPRLVVLATGLDAFADLDALDGGWLAEWGGVFLGVAAEVVGDHPVAAAHALRFLRFCRRSDVRMMLTAGIRSAARLSTMTGYPGQAVDFGARPSAPSLSAACATCRSCSDWIVHGAGNAPMPLAPTPPASTPKEHPGR